MKDTTDIKLDRDNLFESFSRLKILIVGDVMIDQYLHGQVERISPEAPVPVVRMNKNENRLGGAANVVLNIKALGATPILCSVVGADLSGTNFKELLALENLSDEGIIRSEARQTTVKTRILSANQHLLRVDQEDTQDLNEEEAKRLLKRISKIVSNENIDVILFQDYNKGVLSPFVIESVLSKARELDIPTVVDPKYHNFLAYQGTTLFKPNLKEIREAVPFEVAADLASLRRASEYLREKLQHQHTLITLGSKGIFLDDGSEQAILPTQPRVIADVCGAGDTVVSIAALGTAIGLDLKAIAQLANLAGGQVCERVGVVPVDREQLIQESRRLSRVKKVKES